MRTRYLILAATLLTVGGCTTTRSTPLNRSENDRLHRSICPSPRGIPVTIKVPTHVDIYIYEKYYFHAPEAGRDLQEVSMKRPNLWVDVKAVESEKVVTVDWKRPFSGTVAYSATLGNDQYFDAIGSTITDDTIEDVTAAIKAVAAVPTAAGVVGNSELLEDDRVVAFKRFDLDACDIETRILDFVQYHLNNCNNCQGFVPGPLTTVGGDQFPGAAVDDPGDGI